MIRSLAIFINSFIFVYQISVLPQHARVVDQFVTDLMLSVAEVKRRPELSNDGLTGVYGMVSTIPDKSIVDDFLIALFGELFSIGGSSTLSEEFGKSCSEEENSDKETNSNDIFEHFRLNRQSSM